MSSGDMERVSKTNPCPICEKPDWCLVAKDRSKAICQRIQNGSGKKCGDAGWLHILNDRPKDQQLVSQQNSPREQEAPDMDFTTLQQQYSLKIKDEQVSSLSQDLGVTADSLKQLRIGWDDKAYTFPMSDSEGRIIGIRRRFLNNNKCSLTGSKTGLFIPTDLPSEGVLLICEGPTDTAAALDLGFAAIGRPNCNSKVDMTARFVKGRTIVIISDNDDSGKMGATKLASALLLYCQSVKIIYPPKDIKDIRQWLASGLTAEQLKETIEKCDIFNLGVESESEWELPAPLGQFNLPTFPLEAFPEQLCVLCAFCEAVAESFQVPVDLPAMLVLSVGGASLAKRVVINVRGDHWEPVNLFTVVALPPANRKSGVFRNVTEPLTYFEIQEAKRLKTIIEQNRNQRTILEKSLKYAQDQAAKSQKPEDSKPHEDRTRELTQKLNELEILKSPQYIGDDATPESIALLLDDNGGRFALLSPEGDIFDLMAGRYSSNGSPNIGVYLKGHAGDDIRVNRANRDVPARYIHKPALTIGTAVQPDVLRGLTQKKGFRGRGLLGRFLYSLPQSLLGYRKLNPPPVDSNIANEYHKMILDALDLKPVADLDSETCPHVVNVSKEALHELDRFAQKIEKELGPGGEFTSMGDWAGKLVGAVCRIAGIFHGLIHASSGDLSLSKIDAETMLGAIAIGEYLIPHAKAAFFEMGANAAIDSARKILDWVSSNKITEFSRRDAFNALRGGIQKVNELDQPLEILVNHGYIRAISQEHSGLGRKPSPKYQINSLWVAQNTQNTHN